MLLSPGRGMPGNHGGKIARTAHDADAEKAAVEEARSGASDRKPARKRSDQVRADAGMVEAALAAFAHEVRTPLTGILAISDLLATSDLDERERRWVDTIKAGAEHLASLATLFVDAARKPRHRAGRAAGFVRSARARAQRRRFAGRPRGGQGPAVRGRDFREAAGVRDRRSRAPARGAGEPDRQCREVHRAGQRRARGLAACAAPKGKVGVAFAVSDSGIGLTLAEIKRLFRPFSQANVSIASRFGGAGLGLSSVKQLARAMGGDIAVAPRPRRRHHLHADRRADAGRRRR